jgi:hypothetical protein
MNPVPDQDVRRSAHPHFLIDTPEYRGISREFEPRQGLVTKRLRRDEPLQNQWVAELPIRSSVEQLFKEYSTLEMVITGWVDQAVLEFHSVLQGDQGSLAKVLDELDVYRPDQNGDICFYLADLDYNQVLATTFSFEDETLSAAAFQRLRRVI